MGSFASRQNARIEELDMGNNNAYQYPPKSGNYFASHFIMGGERFEVTQPEAYLFGENMDLNFLGGRPTPFPYPAPQPSEPTRTLRSLINIRKESLRFVKTTENGLSGSPSNTVYNIEFTFDSDVRCAITIYYFCTEEITSSGVVYTPRDASMNSETYHYKRGASQQFSQMSHTFDPSKYSEDELNYRFEDDILPVVIQCVAEEGEGVKYALNAKKGYFHDISHIRRGKCLALCMQSQSEPKQSHMLIAVVEKNSDNTYTLKPLKQKLFVDGLCYLLQEIYGIENKNVYQTKDLADDEVEDSGSECVICMSDARDTLILPCRHLCLCNSCADSLRYQANNCPICRAPFRALLQIRAVRKSVSALPHGPGTENQATHDIPPGYEYVSLIEALNGPIQPTALTQHPTGLLSSVTAAPDTPDIPGKRRVLNRLHSGSSSSIPRHGGSPGSDKEVSTADSATQGSDTTPEVVVTVALTPEKSHKSESIPLTQPDSWKHRKVGHTPSAPERVHLLAESAQTVADVGASKRKLEREPAETRSLLEDRIVVNDVPSDSKVFRVAGSPISMSTPHSLHLCERDDQIVLGADMSPGGDDSDYYTPEDPNMTILVDQGTDTTLDTLNCQESMMMSNSTPPSSPQSNNSRKSSVDSLPRTKKFLGSMTRISQDADKTTENLNGGIEKIVNSKPCNMGDMGDMGEEDVEDENLGEQSSLHPHLTPSKHPLVMHLDGSISLPGTPASNASNRSSGDSFSSTSSTRLLLPQRSYDALQE